MKDTGIVWCAWCEDHIATIGLKETDEDSSETYWISICQACLDKADTASREIARKEGKIP